MNIPPTQVTKALVSAKVIPFPASRPASTKPPTDAEGPPQLAEVHPHPSAPWTSRAALQLAMLEADDMEDLVVVWTSKSHPNGLKHQRVGSNSDALWLLENLKRVIITPAPITRPPKIT